MTTRLYSWVCPLRVDKKSDKVVHSGCGGYWTETLPERCPNCGGPIIEVQSIRVVDVSKRICPRCEGIGENVIGRTPDGHMIVDGVNDCPACDGKGTVPMDLRMEPSIQREASSRWETT